MGSMFAAKAAILTELQLIGGRALVFGGGVIALLTLSTG
jgi:hypothetical protein